MYYGERARLAHMQKLLERFAYISIGSDFLIAASTYLVLQHFAYSSSILLVTDYLDLVEVIIACAIVTLIVALRYYKRTVSGLHLFLARKRYRGDIGILG